MKIEHRIGDKEGTSTAHVNTWDLMNNNPTIYLGADLVLMEHLFKTEPHRLFQKKILEYPSFSSYIENNIEKTISHETIHIALFYLTEDGEVSRTFDNVDGLDQITGFVPYAS